MKKSRLLFLTLMIVLSTAAFVQVTKNKAVNEKNPNIILILGDDFGFETISVYGSTSYKTPRIDNMAKGGVLFQNCYAQPLCSPSRVQIMTGKSNFRDYERWGYLPLVAYWKGKIKSGQINDKLVDFTDFLPTIADAVNINIPKSFVTDGRSFLPMVTGQKYDARDWLFSHYDLQEREFKKARFVHNRERKLYETGEIFNVAKDPEEKMCLQQAV